MNNLTPQEQATVELVQQYQRRRFSRRDFLGKALALGLTLPAAASLLAVIILLLLPLRIAVLLPARLPQPLPPAGHLPK
jgi:hypothetical protein